MGRWLGLGRLGLGPGESWRNWRGHHDDDEPTGREPGDRHLRRQLQKAALARPGNRRSLHQRQQEHEIAGWRYRQDVQGLSAEAERRLARISYGLQQAA